MKTMLPTEVRNSWRKVLREVNSGAEEVHIHMKGGPGLVLLSKDHYESILATLEVMSDPKAMRAIRRHKAGLGKKHSRTEIERLIRDTA